MYARTEAELTMLSPRFMCWRAYLLKAIIYERGTNVSVCLLIFICTSIAYLDDVGLEGLGDD